jgi:glycosyltransferase involved in cell wall biosynthesis
MSHHISATIITRNEESTIGDCLRSLTGVADEIIVIDSFSTDKTVEICNAAGCIVRQRRFAGYGAQRQYATSLASHSYVLTIDADEVLSPSLRETLLQLKADGFGHRVYSLSRLNFYCGEPVRRCGWYPDRHIRLFDKRYAAWNLREVQESVTFPDSVRPFELDGDILHYRCRTPEEYASTERRHAGIRGRVIAAHTNRICAIAPILKGLRAFATCYFSEGGIMDGHPGRAISIERYRSTYASYRIARKLLCKRRKSGDSADN